MKRGIQLKQLNKGDLGLLGLPETLLPQGGRDEFGTSPESRPLESRLPPDLVQEVRKELEDTLRLLEQVSERTSSPGKPSATDAEQGQRAGRDGKGLHPPKGV